MKKTTLTIIGWIVSIALLASLTAKIDFRSLWEGIIGASWGWLAIAAMINIVVVALKSLRWMWLVQPARPASYGDIFKATMIGLAGNNVLPARGGDWYKIYLLGRWSGASKATLASVTGLDKVFDGLAILLLFGAMSFHSRFPSWVQKGTEIVSIIIGISLILCILLVIHHRRIPPNKTQELGTIGRLVKNLGAGMSMLTNKGLVLGTIMISVIICLVQVGTIWCCQAAFGVHPDLWVPVLVFVAINLAIIVPSAPSGIGPFEVAAVLAYTGLGLGKEDALNIALMYHAVQFFPVTIIGFVAYLRTISRDAGSGIRDEALNPPSPRPSPL